MSDKKEPREHTLIITEKVDLNEKKFNEEPYLIQISGKETGKMYALKEKVVKVGRELGSQVYLDDPHVSRQHAEIIVKGNDDLVIRDLGSTNGIFINGKRIKEHQLSDGDKILIGTRLYFKFCYQDAVEQMYQQNLFKAANIDSLTQLYNRKYFIDALSREFSFSKRTKQPLTLLIMDVDHFKKINDTYGHQAGDQVLKTIGTILNKQLRHENTACRFGGEEFAIILRNADKDAGFLVAERIRTTIEKELVTFLEQTIQFTVSIGIATCQNGSLETIEDLIRTADENLYEAKELGRNQTVFKAAA